jgi:hypothetical protein
LDLCCQGKSLAPQCGCQPVRDCSRCQGDDCAKCQQFNHVECCLVSKCRPGLDCNGDADCRTCRENKHQVCCAGNALADGCQAPVVQKRCIFWGDPHIETFDGGRPSFYGDGEFWIVKNKDVSIQGRYMGTKYTYGLAATNKVVIAGPFLHGHQIEVEPMDDGGRVVVDGREVCKELGTRYSIDNGLATIVHDDQGQLVDEAASQFKRHMVHISLPLGIQLTVFRWTNYLDLDLRMPKLPGGVDGSCGNFNGDPADDSTQAIFSRVGARVKEGELLFRERATFGFTSEEYAMLKTCATLPVAEKKCRAELENSHPTQPELYACMFDYCFGMNEHALRTARTYATPADRAAAGEMSSTA